MHSRCYSDLSPTGTKRPFLLVVPRHTAAVAPFQMSSSLSKFSFRCHDNPRGDEHNRPVSAFARSVGPTSHTYILYFVGRANRTVSSSPALPFDVDAAPVDEESTGKGGQDDRERRQGSRCRIHATHEIGSTDSSLSSRIPFLRRSTTRHTFSAFHPLREGRGTIGPSLCWRQALCTGRIGGTRVTLRHHNISLAGSLIDLGRRKRASCLCHEGAP